MAISKSISLPRNYIAKFPDRCVVCNRDNPNSHVRIITGTIGWWTWLLWHFGSLYVVKAPACPKCARNLHVQRVLSLASTIGIVVVVIWFIWPHFKDSIPRELRKWAMMAIGLACLLPQIVFEVFFDKPFGVTAYAKSIDYEFTSIAYALDFILLNQDADWIKIDGEEIFEE